MHTSRCGLKRHYESLADKANGTTVVNGLAVLSEINDAFRASVTFWSPLISWYTNTPIMCSLLKMVYDNNTYALFFS